MKKLLLILLCLPMIGLGKDQDRKEFFSFQIGANRLIPFNDNYVHTNTGISTNFSYKQYIKDNVKYIPSISFNLVSFTRNYGFRTYNSNFSSLNIGNGIEYDINNRLSISSTISFDFLLKDKGTYSFNLDNLTFGDMIDPEFGFLYSTAEDMPNVPSVIEYERTVFDKGNGGLGYYCSFDINLSYVIYQTIKSSYFVFASFNIPFYFQAYPPYKYQSKIDLQFNRFSSVGIGFNF